MHQIANHKSIELILFSTHEAQVKEAELSGIDGIIVDLEKRGKSERQQGADTAISEASFDDLRMVREIYRGNLICRIDNSGTDIREEASLAIDCGADEVLLPMVKHAAQVKALVESCGTRVKAGILVETEEALRDIETLAAFPLFRVYVGFNDLSIAMGTYPNLFMPLLDGTVEYLRSRCPMKFGFGGLTLPQFGSPIPCTLIMSEMSRIGCDFTFLRRSFFRDVRPGKYGDALKSIRSRYREMCGLNSSELDVNHQRFAQAVKEAFQ